AERAGWGTPLPDGRFRGVACFEGFGSYVAQVAEVSVDKVIRVHRVVCAIDCGRTINPDTIEAQCEGGIVFGLTAALHGRITIAGGRVVEGNFGDYPLISMADAPLVETHIVSSTQPPGGVGEAAVPCVAPAVANAVFAATGRRLRSLPLTL